MQPDDGDVINHCCSSQSHPGSRNENTGKPATCIQQLHAAGSIQQPHAAGCVLLAAHEGRKHAAAVRQVNVKQNLKAAGGVTVSNQVQATNRNDRCAQVCLQ